VSLQFAPVSGPLPGAAAPAEPAAAVRAVPVAVCAGDLALARRGDREAFARLVRLHQARVFSVALRLTGRHEDAEELAQDAFVQLHGALTQIADEGHLAHWLLRAVTHRSIDRLRQRGRQPHLVPLEAAGEDIAAEQTDPLSARRLQGLLQVLPVPARAVLLLRYQEDLDPPEIAALLDMPLNTVKSHLRRSLDALRALHGGPDGI
jgi:RNA polymerase sigma-70 factor (ECF subfamily)